MDGQGMMAVVRGLRDSQLAVTLFDSGRQYTLMPEDTPTTKWQTTGSQCLGPGPIRPDTSVQTNDSRYTTTYRMMYCHSTPTSPSEFATEFPPQRTNATDGQGSFEVGGMGSGDKYFQTSRSNSFRGGLNWTDRGSVFSPKPSLQMGTFANSLRKYPSLPREKSSEILERLITYTQNKNVPKYQRPSSPIRAVGKASSNLIFSVQSRNFSTHRPQSRESDIMKPNRLDESPTRERPRCPQSGNDQQDYFRKSTFSKTNDIRYLRDVCRKAREHSRSMSPCPSSQPERLYTKINQSIQHDQRNCSQRPPCPPERYIKVNQSVQHNDKRNTRERSIKTVNMETQAAVQMVSREILTAPRVIPTQRTIATSLSPTPSVTDERPDMSITEEVPPQEITQEEEQTNENIQSFEISNVVLQTAVSSVDVCISNRCDNRRSQSQDKFKLNAIGTNIIKMLHSSQLPITVKSARVHCQSNSLLYNDKYKSSIGNIEDYKLKDGKIDNLINVYSNVINDPIKARYYPKILNLRPTSTKCMNDHELAIVINCWLNLLPVVQEDIVEKEYIFDYLFDLLKLRTNVLDYNWRNKLKSNILDVLSTISIVSQGNRRIIINKLADVLIENVKNIIQKKRVKKGPFNHNIEWLSNKQCLASEEKEYRSIISDQIKLILNDYDNYGVIIDKFQVEEIENELVNIFATFIGTLYTRNEKYMMENMIEILQNHGLSEQNAVKFTKILINHLKKALIIQTGPIQVRSENFIVSPSLGKPMFTPPKLKRNIQMDADQNINHNSDRLTNQLCKEINEWLDNLKIPNVPENSIVQIVVHDLAIDIIDRYKYLESNPNSRGSDEIELEVLKYQIFKWVNKLIGENNLRSIEYAPDLMSRIKRIFLSKSHGDAQESKISRTPSRKEIDYTLNQEINSEIDKNTLIISRINDSIYHRSKGLETDISTKPPIVSESPHTLYTATKSPSVGQIKHINFICLPAQMPGSCCLNLNPVTRGKPSTDQLNEEYHRFLENWVQQIPISSSLENGATPEILRQGILNGIWKTLTKINCEPTICQNKFLYEDTLDDAVEDLLNCLPQTNELLARKHCLKIQLVTTTTDTLERIIAFEKSFKRQLEQNVAAVRNKYGGKEECSAEKNVIHSYILFMKYKNDNPAKADIYQNKFINEINNFLEQMKEFNSFDSNLFRNDVIDAVQKVARPGEDVINNETDDIFTDLEIEQWINDLPIVFDNENSEQEQQKQLKYIIISKLKQVDTFNVPDRFYEIDLKNDIYGFFRTARFKENSEVNLDFVIDEFVNRMKNFPRNGTCQNTKRVAFIEPNNYDSFKRDMPFHSSLIEPRIEASNTKGDFCSVGSIESRSRKYGCRQCCSRTNNDYPNINGVSYNMSNSSATNEPCQQWNTFYSRCQHNNNLHKVPNCYVVGGPTSAHWHTVRNFCHPVTRCAHQNMSNSPVAAQPQPKMWRTLRDSACRTSNKILRNKLNKSLIKTKIPSNQVNTCNDSQRPMCNFQSKGKDRETQLPDFPLSNRQYKTYNLSHQPDTVSSKTIFNSANNYYSSKPEENDIRNQFQNRFNLPNYAKSETLFLNRTFSIDKPADVRSKANPLTVPTLDPNYYKTNHPLHTYNTPNYDQNTENMFMHYCDFHKKKSLNQSNLLNVSVQNSPIGCQIETGTFFGVNPKQSYNVELNASTNQFNAHGAGTLTPQGSVSQGISLEPNRKRKKYTLVKEHSNQDDPEEDEDETLYRCLDRYWRLKHKGRLPYEPFGNYPPIVPMFYPFPCYL